MTRIIEANESRERRPVLERLRQDLEHVKILAGSATSRVDRLRSFARCVTCNGSRRAWYLQLDIRGFFIALNRQILYRRLAVHEHHPAVRWLTRQILFTSQPSIAGFEGPHEPRLSVCPCSGRSPSDPLLVARGVLRVAGLESRTSVSATPRVALRGSARVVPFTVTWPCAGHPDGRGLKGGSGGRVSRRRGQDSLLRKQVSTQQRRGHSSHRVPRLPPVVASDTRCRDSTRGESQRRMCRSASGSTCQPSWHRPVGSRFAPAWGMRRTALVRYVVERRRERTRRLERT